MKKLLLVLVLILVGISARAQFYVGGSLGLKVEKVSQGSSSETQTSFMITPEFGYSYDKTWSLGAQIGFNIVSNDGDLKTFTAIPYVRCAFARAGIVDFLGELGVGYGHQSYRSNGVSGLIAALRPGLAINFTPAFALIARSNLFRYEYWDGVKGTTFSVNDGFDLGFQFKF